MKLWKEVNTVWLGRHVDSKPSVRHSQEHQSLESRLNTARSRIQVSVRLVVSVIILRTSRDVSW